MSVTFPEAVSSQGRKKVVVLTEAPGTPAALTPAEITAGVESTMYFQGQFAPGGAQNKGNAPRRTGESAQLEVLGNASYQSPTLSYVHDPQGSPTDEANLVKTALPEGSTVWIVERTGIDSETPFAPGDRYKLHHLNLGVQWEVPSGDDEFAVEQVTQETGYVTRPVPGVVAA